jgi:hypothetical protein
MVTWSAVDISVSFRSTAEPANCQVTVLGTLGRGTNRPSVSTTCLPALRAPVRRVPSVGSQLSSAMAIWTSSADCQSPTAADTSRSPRPP